MRALSPVVGVLLLLLLVSGCTERVKEPSVAGMFYPGDEKTLRETVRGFLRGQEGDQAGGRPLVLVAPHAGYQYSGHIAGSAYRRILGADIDTVILIGPSHRMGFRGASVLTEGSMRTPLGKVGIHEKIARSLVNAKSDIAALPEAFDGEHSLEVQLPFLQETLRGFRVVPVLVGSPSRESFEYLTERLADILRTNRKAIIVASTDLSHYHDYRTAVMMDGKMTDAVERMSVEDVERYLMTGEAEMCGGYPVLYAMAAAREVGATNGSLFQYANSGDVTDDKGRVVGYAAMGLYRSELSPAERQELLSLARRTVMQYVSDGSAPEASVRGGRLRANGATFVTVTMHGALRGCIGNINPSQPLYRSVISNAVSASSGDPRFPPMTREELKDMEVEVSVLSPFTAVKDVGEIEVGKHGLYLVNGQNSGLLLPQVASDNRWDRKTFLEEVSVKAGLGRDAWKTAQLYTFSADVIR